MLVDGEWVTDAHELTNEEGEFRRNETTFRDWIGEDGFAAETGRYNLYISRACPWAHRTAITRKLRGLESHISLSLVDPVRVNDGWEFSDENSDPLYDKSYLRDIYIKADSDYTGRVTVPVLWDREQETIVNNESREIMRMLDTEFSALASDESLYPTGLQEEVDDVIEEIYTPINNGVYRAGFAGTQKAYMDAVNELFDALDHWNDVLGEQRYLAGDVLTEADICMFPTLIRFDKVYHTHFKCNKKRIIDHHNLWNYTKDIYQIPGVAETVNMDHIRRHYYMSHRDINPGGLVAVGPDLDLESSHDRDRFLD